jgi:hypothetical protein
VQGAEGAERAPEPQEPPGPAGFGVPTPPVEGTAWSETWSSTAARTPPVEPVPPADPRTAPGWSSALPSASASAPVTAVSDDEWDEEPETAVPYVGHRPPLYEAEPATLPAADPAALAELVPDTVLDGAHYGGLTLRAASLRGDSARHRGALRRDALLTARFGAGESALLLVAVAAGGRSSTGGHRAARELCHAIGGAIGRSHTRLAEDIRGDRRGALKSGLQRLTDRCYGKLRAQAAALGVPPEGYTADLRCLLVSADPRCRTRIFFGAGGGGLFRLRRGAWQDIEGAVGEPGEPGMPPPASPEPDPFRFQVSVARRGDTLLLCSPGLAQPLRAEPAFADGLALRWAGRGEPPGLATFLADVQLRVRGYAEDRTAVAVWEG